MFKKTPHPDENVAKKGIRKMDKVVTGLLLGGVIASIYGVKKMKEHSSEKEREEDEEFIGEETPEKRSILKRILFGNK